MNAIQRLKTRLAAATPGPWTLENPGRDDDGWPIGLGIAYIGGRSGSVVFSLHQGGQMPFADANLIADSRNAMAALLEVAEAAAALDELIWCRPLSDEVGPAQDRLHAALETLSQAVPA